METETRASETAQMGKAPATWLYDVGLISGIHIWKERIPASCPLMCTFMMTHTHTNM